MVATSEMPPSSPAATPMASTAVPSRRLLRARTATTATTSTAAATLRSVSPGKAGCFGDRHHDRVELRLQSVASDHHHERRVIEELGAYQHGEGGDRHGSTS